MLVASIESGTPTTPRARAFVHHVTDFSDVQFPFPPPHPSRGFCNGARALAPLGAGRLSFISSRNAWIFASISARRRSSIASGVNEEVVGGTTGSALWGGDQSRPSSSAIARTHAASFSKASVSTSSADANSFRSLARGLRRSASIFESDAPSVSTRRANSACEMSCKARSNLIRLPKLMKHF